MRYSLRHRTTYSYGAPVGFARCNLRLTPESGRGQEVLATEIEVTPAPATRSARRSFFGHEVVAVTVEVSHAQLVIEARSEVSVEREHLRGMELSSSWEAVRDHALHARDLSSTSPVHFVPPSPRVPILPIATHYARRSFPPGRSLVEGARDLMGRIHADFAFDNRATTVSTPLAEVAAKRRGVCQDFAHVMIAGLRGLGLPAAYVSGYIRTLPPPGRERLRGADASHAWVSVWTGQGWLDLDPTNDTEIGDDHIVVARGRDYADVSPVDGIILASGGQRLTVEVDVVPQDERDGEGRPAGPALLRTA